MSAITSSTTSTITIAGSSVSSHSSARRTPTVSPVRCSTTTWSPACSSLPHPRRRARPPRAPQRAVHQHAAGRLGPAPDHPDVADQALGPGADPPAPHRQPLVDREREHPDPTATSSSALTKAEHEPPPSPLTASTAPTPSAMHPRSAEHPERRHVRLDQDHDRPHYQNDTPNAVIVPMVRLRPGGRAAFHSAVAGRRLLAPGRAARSADRARDPRLSAEHRGVRAARNRPSAVIGVDREHRAPDACAESAAGGRRS